MNFSRCFQRSPVKKKLGCISCHTPHETVAAEDRVGYYRECCLDCHRQRGCAVPRETRLRQNKEDSCIDCHMPPYGTSDIAHTAATDHRILRKRERRMESPRAAQPPSLDFPGT